jgi:hypothetical protein
LCQAALQDEDSPFNECSHAHFAATQALLRHLQNMPGDHAAARALMATVELEMLGNRASLVLCRYSGKWFNTAKIIRSNWPDVPSPSC